MAGKALVAIIAIFLLLGAFATPILNGIKNWRTDGGGTTQTELITTAAAQTSANVTLDKDLYQAITSSVTSITSTDGTDTPVATAYDEDTLALTIAGLNDDASRTLTIVYDGETDDNVMRVIGPFLGVLVIGGLVGVMLWDTFQSRKKRFG
jgi:hypothetical protein